MYFEDILSSAGLDIKSFDYTEPIYPICGILIFLIIVGVSNQLKIKSNGTDPKKFKKSTTFQTKLFITFHNMSLCVFSSQCCINCFRLVFNILGSGGLRGWSKFICYEYPLMYSYPSEASENNISRYLYWFYLSKYYEMTDVFILIQQGKSASFFKIYHHIGTILITWINLVGHVPHFFIFVLLTSMYESIMYWFYAMITWETMGYVLKRYKHLVLGLQIICFVYGTLMCFVQSAIFMNCIQKRSHWIYAITQLFTIGLMIMFIQFKNKKYADKKKLQAEKNTLPQKISTKNKPKTHKYKKKSKKK